MYTNIPLLRIHYVPIHYTGRVIEYVNKKCLCIWKKKYNINKYYFTFTVVYHYFKLIFDKR